MSFQYEVPTDWAEAGRLLAQSGAVAKMGGCDVLTRFRSGRLDASRVVSLRKLPGVDEFSVNADHVRIGAALTLDRLTRFPEFVQGWPLLAATIDSIASPAIRGTATLVGNVAQGWDVSDLVPLLQVCGAELHIRGPQGDRRISVSDYARQRRNGALKPAEVIVALEMKTSERNARLAYRRFAFKEGFDLPLVAVAIRASGTSGPLNHVRVAVVGGKAMPALCEPAEVALEGQTVNERVIADAASAVRHWAEPPGDFRASASYRRHLVETLLMRALADLKG
jgi:CO/xanthine dehydrogenase FAD-binding subunit